jgi:hypothetical protein
MVLYNDESDNIMSNKLEMMFTPSKRKFEGSKEDIEITKSFLVKKQWGNKGCPFYLEWPYLTIPDMLKDKLTRHYLQIKS